jgi:hypothetical protein
MPTVQIRNLTPTGVLAFDLREVLVALGPRALKAFWTIGGVTSRGEALDATGDGAAALEQLARSGERVSGVRLEKIARKVKQVIWGEFNGYEDSSENPWVTVIAFDSSWYEIQSADATALDRIRSAFRQVRSVR